MTLFAVYGNWQAEAQALSEAAQDAVARNLAAIDAQACVWVESETPNVLRLSADIYASTFEEALGHGRAALGKAVGAVGLPGGLVLVSASTEEAFVVWQPEDSG